MNPKILHRVHVGGQVPAEMHRFIFTHFGYNPAWELKFWYEENLYQLGLNYHQLLDKYQAPVHVAEVVRLEAVKQMGGVYLDCDVEVIKPLDALLQYKAFAAIQDGSGQVCNAVFGAEPNHPWIQWQLDNADNYFKLNQPWSVTLMTQAPRKDVTLVPTDTFYPWLWTTPKEERKPTENTLAIHHWKGSWAPWVIRDRS